VAQPPTHVLLDDCHRARAQHYHHRGLLHARHGYHDRPRVLDLPEASPSTAVTGRKRRRRRGRKRRRRSRRRRRTRRRRRRRRRRGRRIVD
jgi:hypothetical protein